MSEILSPAVTKEIVMDRPPRSWRLRINNLLTLACKGIRRCPGPIQYILSPLRLVLEGASLGLMRIADVDQMVRSSYESLPTFYDPRQYKLPHEERLLPALISLADGRRSMLDAFCGQGREAALFSQQGFEVTGIDCLDWMIDAARKYSQELGFQAKFVTADFNTYQPSQRYDIVYTSCWMYSTCQTVTRRTTFLKRCAELCREDGLIVISYVSSRDDSQLAAWVRYLVARCVAQVTSGNIQTEFGERIYTGLFWHHLADETVSEEITAAGLRILHQCAGQGTDPTFCVLTRSFEEQAG